MSKAIRIFTFLTACFYLCGSLYSQNSKGNWQWLGPKTMPEQVMGNVSALWVDTNDLNFVLAGSAAGGLWKCENAQSKTPAWKNISDTYDSISTGVFDICVKPFSQNKIIYIGTKTATRDISKPYGNGILKTIDGGENWSRVAPAANIVIDRLAMCADDPDVMVAASDKELYITVNDWKDHKKIKLPSQSTDPTWQICDVDFAPFDTKIIYVCTRAYNGSMAEIWMSKDLGDTWSNISHGIKGVRVEAAVVRQKKFGDKLFIAYGNNEVYVQYFDGKTWSANLNVAPIQQVYAGTYWNFEFEVNQRDTNVMYVAMTESHRSLDGGKTFQRTSNYNAHNTHADIRAMCIGKSTLKGEKDILFLGSDGGISQSEEGLKESTAWKNVNGFGLGITQFWGLDVLQSDTLLIAGGTQDNSMFWLRDSIWKNNFNNCGDAYDAVALSPRAFLIECGAPTILQNNIQTNNYWSLPLPDNYYKGFSRPLKNIKGKIYLGHRDLYEYDAKRVEGFDYKVKNKSNFESFTDIDGNYLNYCINCFDICERTMNSACVAFSNPIWEKGPLKGKLWFTRNFKTANPLWEDITRQAVFTNLEICRWSEIYDVAVDDVKEDLIYMISRNVFNQAECRMFFMEFIPDSGKWIVSDKTFNLPHAGFNRIIKEKDSDILYLGTDAGVYYTNKKLLKEGRWEKFNGADQKLPACIVTDLVLNYETNKLFCSTYARGIWQGKLASDLADDFIYSKNTSVNETISLDGKLVVKKNAVLEINSKLFISKGSVIELKKGTKLIIRKQNVFDYDGGPTDLKPFLKVASGATVVYK